MTPLRILGVASLALAAALALLSDFAVLMLVYVGLYAIVALGLVMMTGIGGMTSFGQAAFVGLGAYATALVCTHPQALALVSVVAGAAWLPWLGLAAGLALTIGIAFLLGQVTTGLKGHYLPLATLAWGISLAMVFGSSHLLGGYTGISGLPAIEIGELSLRSPRALGVLVSLILLGAIWILQNLLDSREGRAIRAVRSTRVMAESMGVDTSRQRLRVFVLAAVLACVSGWLYAHLQRFVNPTPFGLAMGVEYLFMTVVGGAGSLWGALVGAGVVTIIKHELEDVLPRLLGSAGNFEAIFFGVLMLLVLARYQGGICGAVERLFRHRERSTAARHSSAPAELPGRKPLERNQVVLRSIGLGRRYGGLVANNNVSLELRAGQIHALIGPNGAGKSTLFNLLSGVDSPSSGEVELLGEPMTGRSAREFAARGLSRTFQHAQLLTERSVIENVCLGGHLRGTKGWLSAMFRTDRAEEAALLADARWQLSRCGLAQPDVLAGSLALGQQRLLEIARALAAHPHVLLLDEPAAGLRAQEKRALAQLLRMLREEGLAVLIVEHDMDFVMELADTMTVLSFGQVIAHGQPREIQRSKAVQEAYLGLESEEEVVDGV